MNPISLAELSSVLRHPQVRDLAWTLLSPPLLSETPPHQRHPLSASRWHSEPGLLADWLLCQDAEPSVLEAWLSQRSNRRLGLYYERLWQYALCQAPDLQLIAANLPIRQNGSTLGELDLLFCDDQGVHHLELAIKLYLGFGPGDGSQHDHWLGPGNHDRLDLKLAHLRQHQLPLCNQPAARAVLAELTGREVQSSFWLSGYLFQPWPEGCAPPHGANPHHLSGRWLRQADWPVYQAAAAGTIWQPLPRAAWLAAARVPQPDLWASDRLAEWLAGDPARARAQLLVRLEPHASGDWLEQERLFLVADDWPHNGESARASSA
ncbi:DUF1853 family protein [Stutzerimonas stutzeri]|uniref:DUF1853 family protein n=1 Tax=Stutzerimonas stutzeri TaxID=316 RepID=UPI0002D5403F|nr:DUF1853 family protein [Stutzerimonas stutzeri]